MTGGNKIPKIDELINRIPKTQIAILKEIWDYFLKTNEWPKGRPFRKDRRLIVEKLIADLSPLFVWHYNKGNSRDEYYRLTTEGVYAVEGLEGANIQLLLSYLDYLRKKFDEDPEFEKVTAQELRDKLQIVSEETRILGELFEMGNIRLWGSGASGLRSSDWEVGVIDDIEILYESNTSQEFLFKRWNDHIEGIINSSRELPSILGIKRDPLRTPVMESEQPPIAIQESLARFKDDYPDQNKVAFIMMQFGKTKAHEEIVKAIKSALDSHDIRGFKADDKQYHDDLLANVQTYLYGCGFGIAVFERIEADDFNPNVSLEVGHMLAMKKPVCLLKDQTLQTLQTDLVGKLYKEFDPLDPGKTIPDEISKWLSDKEIV
jgi:hypothetical protein